MKEGRAKKRGGEKRGGGEDEDKKQTPSHSFSPSMRGLSSLSSPAASVHTAVGGGKKERRRRGRERQNDREKVKEIGK